MMGLFSSFRWPLWPVALLIAMLTLTSANAGEVTEQARAAIQNGRYDAAADMLHAEITQHGGNEQTWFLLGVAYVRKQQFQQAIEAFRQVIRLNPTLAEPHNNLAVIYNKLGDTHAAVTELEASLEKQPGYVVAEKNLAELYLKLALHYYKSTLDKAPTPELRQRYTRLLHVRDPYRPDADALEEDAAAPVEVEQTQPDTAADEELQQPVDDHAGPEAEDDAQAAVATSEPAVETDSPTAVAKAESGVEAAEDTPEVEVAAPVEAVSYDKATVLAAVESWRAAWSARDMEGYFSAYADDFTPPARFKTLDEWKSYKHRVITGKQYIHVELSDLQVQFDADKSRATVRFLQSFRSDTYSGDDVKELLLERDGRGWKISREDSVS